MANSCGFPHQSFSADKKKLRHTQVLQVSRRPLSESRIFSVASDASRFHTAQQSNLKRQLDTYGCESKPRVP